MKYRISVTRIEIESNKFIGACVYLWWSYKYSHIVHTLLASARFLDHISVLIKAWFLDHWLFLSRCSINLFQITSAINMLLRVGTCDVVRISPSLLWIDRSNLILRSVLPHITDTCSHPTYSHISTPTWLPFNTTYVCSPTSIHRLSQYPRHFQLKCFRRLLGLKLLTLQCQPFSDATATSPSQTLSSGFSHTRLQSQAEYHPPGIDDESAKTVVSAELRQMEEWKNDGISGMEELIQWCWSLDMSIASVHRNIDNRTSIWFQLK